MSETKRLLVEIDLPRLGYAPPDRLRRLLTQAGEAIQGTGAGHEMTTPPQQGLIMEGAAIGRQRVVGTWKIALQQYDEGGDD